jgi:hypothetical protein
MTQDLHDIIHLLSEIEKEETIQAQSHERKKKLWDEVGKTIDRMVKNDNK